MMKRDVAAFLNAIRRDKTHDVLAWREVISGLLNSFRAFLGSDFEHDPNPSVDVTSPSFVQWIWSKPARPEMLTVMWSAVIAGNLVDDESEQTSFAVIATLFIFSEIEKKRLVTLDGKGFLRFSFSQNEWTSLGWCEDTFGEWADFTFPEDA